MEQQATGRNRLQARRTYQAEAQGVTMRGLRGGCLLLKLTATSNRARKKQRFVGECCVRLAGETKNRLFAMHYRSGCPKRSRTKALKTATSEGHYRIQSQISFSRSSQDHGITTHAQSRRTTLHKLVRAGHPQSVSQTVEPYLPGRLKNLGCKVHA